MQIWQHSVNRKDLQALTIVGTPRNNLEPDTLAELHLDNWLYTIIILLQGVRASTVDACVHQDPCRHGGVCISTDSGPLCDCENIDFTGVFCEKGNSKLFIFASELWGQSYSTFLQIAILQSCPRPWKFTLSTSNLNFSFLKGVPLSFVWIKTVSPLFLRK